MKTCYISLLALSGLLGRSAPALGQQRPASEPLAAAVEAATARYNKSFVASPQLYNGPEYVDYSLRYHARTGHQFFATPDKMPGSVYYNDHYFPNLRLAYDVVLEQVIITQPTSPLNLRLINEYVREFTIGNHHFVRIQADSSTGRVLSTGYYELLVDDSRLQVLAKRAKNLQEVPAQGFLNVEYITADKFYLKKAGVYTPISSKSAVLRSFADHKKEVQQHIKEKHLRFSKAGFGASVTELALYYVSLLPQP
ncbi:hypothetical protein KB206_15675 [Microvirga sp. STS02]|uniref:hypothetical protein n=1 Tax=Hymenobacter negativus TaxID=2795026 RepID=UPI0018DCEF3C|nr:MULTISPECIES: hypothetical protein [Bacteria]MBH8570331.1 hypothetical protein [Hymenobacter negativus]MBR7210070.1 hypothetical protein [Microvirga sp. STS02]